MGLIDVQEEAQNYWMISSFHVNKLNNATIIIASCYANKTVRENDIRNKSAIRGFKTTYLSSLAEAYNYLKTIPEFSVMEDA